MKWAGPFHLAPAEIDPAISSIGILVFQPVTLRAE